MEYTNNLEDTKTEYIPTSIQVERRAALKRFNWYFVYTPVIIAAILGLFVVGLLFWATFIAPGESNRETVSGIASSVIILASVPMTLLCALPSVLFIGLFYQMRKQGTAPTKSVQKLFWRIETLILRVQSFVDETAPKVANVVISGHGLAASIRILLTQFIKLFKRS